MKGRALCLATCAALAAGAAPVPGEAQTRSGTAGRALPRNGVIAFVSARGGIAVIGANGRGFRRLTRDRRDHAPAWSPTGTRIAFARGNDLYVMRADGTRRRRLARGEPTDAWSPDGTSIAFGRAGDLFVIGADGRGLRQLTRTPEFDAGPEWSPDGRRVAFVRDDSLIVVVDADGANAAPLYQGSELEPPRWSPDGTALAFGEQSSEPGIGAIVAVSAEGGEPWIIDVDGDTDDDGLHVVDGFPVNDGGPVWSPTGARIAFARTIWLCGRCDEEGVWTIRSNGTDAVQVVRVGGSPAWSPDGKRLVVEAAGGLSIFGPRGGAGTVLPVPGSQPTWQPR